MKNNNIATTLQGNKVEKNSLVSVNSESIIWSRLKRNSELKKVSNTKKETATKPIKPIGEGVKLTEITVNLNKFSDIQRAKKEGYKVIEFVDNYGFMLPNVNLELKGKSVNEILKEALTYLVRNLKEKQIRTAYNKELKKLISEEKEYLCKAEKINPSIDNDVLYKRLYKSNFDEIGFPLHTKLILQITYNNNIVRYLLDAKALSDNKTKVNTVVNLGIETIEETK